MINEKHCYMLILLFIAYIPFLSCERDTNMVGLNETDTTSYLCNDTVSVDKPNIYIYPVESMGLIFIINFPQGGSIVESIPLYEECWNIQIEPSGLIDNQYTFLFYECRVPDRFQYKTGWQIEGSQLERFFRNNLSTTGFIETEIEDFIDYWIPRLESTDNYLVYPQYNDDIAPLIELQCSEEPESLLRFLYIIETKKSDNEIILIEPVIPKFERKGFTIAEWGVILK